MSLSLLEEIFKLQSSGAFYPIGYRGLEGTVGVDDDDGFQEKKMSFASRKIDESWMRSGKHVIPLSNGKRVRNYSSNLWLFYSSI